ncbi:TM2 domain-containing membrane protein YozV [Clostridium pascui]|uniref:hypothetical protein n=1 Tax=Clostridium pascui TaxID=46609 RepID=UPI0019561899|nr:hypothetical protein [Clostridium pascui]MBM7871036.1 TM2 domain-containing membrane protein YozV [Clostridium pascui]
MRRSSVLTFLAALIPGVGYMYLGLMKKGLEALAIYLLIEPVFGIIGLGLAGILKIIFWFYTFIDTFNLANRIDRGEIIMDSSFIMDKFSNNNGTISNNFQANSKKLWNAIGILFIIIGIMAILDKTLVGLDIYYYVKSVMNKFLVPIILVLFGVYILFKGNKQNFKH